MIRRSKHTLSASSRHPIIASSSGFTLLEMAVVLAIVSISSVSLVVMFSATLQKAQYRQTVAKMNTIQQALVNFRIAFNRLPCPADITVDISSANFGREAANPGSCISGTPAANFSLTPAVNSQDAREGMVPTMALELPDDYAFDGWGRRIMYAVSKDMTQNGAFTIINTYDSLPRMTVLNAEDSQKSTQACEVLVSFGPNGHGAYPRNGGTTRVNSASVNADEWNNCDCNNNLTPSNFDGIFVQKDYTPDPTSFADTFDDLVYFTSRGDYVLPSTLLTQPSRFSTSSNGVGNVSSGGLSGGVGGGTGAGIGHYSGMCLGGPAICKAAGGIKQCICGY